MPFVDQLAKPHILAVISGYLVATLTYTLGLVGMPWSLETVLPLLLFWSVVAVFGGPVLLSLLVL